MSANPPQDDNQQRSRDSWAAPVDRLKVSEVPAGATVHAGDAIGGGARPCSNNPEALDWVAPPLGFPPAFFGGDPQFNPTGFF